MTAGRIAIALGVVAALCAGLWLGGHPRALPGPLEDVFVDERVALLSEALEEIEDNYYRRVNGRRLENSSIEGMIRSLRKRNPQDKFSHYFDPRAYARFKESTEGEFSGVGLAVNGVKRGLRVAKVFDGSPAKRAGIKPGDVIVAVNGRSIAGVDEDTSTARIKGRPGTKVRLTIASREEKRRRTLHLTRARISVPTTDGRLLRRGGRKIAYVEFTSFSRGASEELRQELERLYQRGAEGVVLDLRGNGGGLLTEAVLVSSLFVPEGRVIVTTRGRTQGTQVLRAQGGRLPAKPTVALINRDTASAAEILAAVLDEYHLATLLGRTTFGKGLVQEVIELPNKGALDLTIAEYLTPKGRSLGGRGIKPDDEAVDRRATRRDEAREEALSSLERRLDRSR